MMLMLKVGELVGARIPPNKEDKVGGLKVSRLWVCAKLGGELIEVAQAPWFLVACGRAKAEVYNHPPEYLASANIYPWDHEVMCDVSGEVIALTALGGACASQSDSDREYFFDAVALKTIADHPVAGVNNPTNNN